MSTPQTPNFPRDFIGRYKVSAREHKLLEDFGVICWEESRKQALEEAAKVCEEGTTTLQRDGINEGKPWQTRNDPNGYCAKAIREMG